MRQLLLFAILTCTVIHASAFKQGTRIIEGDLYYSVSLFSMASLYRVPRQFINKAKRYFDTATIEHASDNEKQLIAGYAVLKKENLVFSPYIYVKLDNDSIIVVYMNKRDYARITRYRYKKLRENNKKVRLQISVNHIGYSMFTCQSLMAADAVNGETLAVEHKIKVEDYD